MQDSGFEDSGFRIKDSGFMQPGTRATRSLARPPARLADGEGGGGALAALFFWSPHRAAMGLRRSDAR